jgi:hypothetical protein
MIDQVPAHRLELTGALDDPAAILCHPAAGHSTSRNISPPPASPWPGSPALLARPPAFTCVPRGIPADAAPGLPPLHRPGRHRWRRRVDTNLDVHQLRRCRSSRRLACIPPRRCSPVARQVEARRLRLVRRARWRPTRFPAAARPAGLAPRHLWGYGNCTPQKAGGSASHRNGRCLADHWAGRDFQEVIFDAAGIGNHTALEPVAG